MGEEDNISKIQRDLEELKSLIIILNQEELEKKKKKTSSPELNKKNKFMIFVTDQKILTN